MTPSISKHTNTAEAETELNFLLSERVSKRWACFLLSFSVEMQSQLSSIEYRNLLRSMGMKMAEQLPIGENDTVESLQENINKQLKNIQWGYVKLVDTGAVLSIHHYLNPLSEMLNVDSEISGGFLEGVYEKWFRSTGASEELSVRQVLGSATATTVEYQFGRH